MSIINDALKKAGKSSPLSRNDPHRKRWLFWLGTGVVFLLAVFVATSTSKSPTDSVSLQETISETKSSQNAFNLRAIDLERPLRLSDLRLSGILYDEEKPLAIINSRIVGEGALINGARLLEIQSDQVRFSRKGKEFTLKVK